MLFPPQHSLSFYERFLNFAEEITESIGETVDTGTIFSGLGNAYYSLGDYPKAIDYHQQALNIAQEIGNKSDFASALGNLGPRKIS